MECFFIAIVSKNFIAIARNNVLSLVCDKLIISVTVLIDGSLVPIEALMNPALISCTYVHFSFSLIYLIQKKTFITILSSLVSFFNVSSCVN